MKLVALSMVSLLACAAGDEDVDAIDGTFAGKGDAFGIEDGSPQARGVLRVANELAETVLDDEVGLARRAATGIVAGRPFATLAELDAVPYVGSASFARLLAYAEDNGFVTDRALLLTYQYGNQISGSELMIYDDGVGDLEERITPTDVRKSQVALIQADYDDLIGLSEQAKAGTLTTRRGGPTTFGSASGSLVVYPVSGGGAVTIHEITRDNDGDSYDQVTTNDDPGVPAIRQIAHELVERDMPN